MGVSTEQLNRAVAKARELEAAGYFGLVKAGDKRAASLFARLTAYELNPTGDVDDYGWLTKNAGETNVDGYAEDAIVLGLDPMDLQNVVDLINGAGAPGASIGGAVKERRPHNVWVRPMPLSDADMAYLRSGGGGSVPAPSIPSYEAMGGDEGGKKVTRLMEADYKRAEKPGLDGDSGAWQWRTAYDFLAGICKTVEESIAKHQPEWRQSLNDERAAQGKPPIAW